MLLDKRNVYYPFEYPKAMEFWLKQQQAFWLPDEINLSGDIIDWEHRLTASEKQLIEQTLKGFTQAEILIENYWNSVGKWFPKPEIASMASAMANMETIHAKAYSHLQITLGMNNFDAFMQDAAARNKLDNLIVRQKTIEDKAMSLAVFSGFAEGVSLFSSFAILMNYSRFNKLKGIGQIVAFSSRDESLHSEAGCWLFRQLVSEHGKDFWVDDFKKEIYEAARVAVKLEDDFIDRAFDMGAVEGLNPKSLKEYIRFRANTKLNDLGLKTNWKNLDKAAIHSVVEWFEVLSSGVEHGDFFAVQVSAYSKGVSFDDSMFE